jgi:uncharacterized protein (TIGR04255 family)
LRCFGLMRPNVYTSAGGDAPVLDAEPAIATGSTPPLRSPNEAYAPFRKLPRPRHIPVGAPADSRTAFIRQHATALRPTRQGLCRDPHGFEHSGAFLARQRCYLPRQEGNTRMRPLVGHRRDFGDKAPITEALIDIQVTTPDDLELDKLREFDSLWPGRFPTSRLQTRFESQIRVEGNPTSPSVTTQHAVRGFALFTAEPDRVVQIRRDGFSFSKLHPYDSWDSLRREALELWSRYKEVARPTIVRRLAVRYINRFPLPSERVELHEWFNLHPKSPDPLGPMEEFLLRMVVRHPERPEYRAITTQATLPPGPDGRHAIVLDIDVFTVVELEPESDRIWQTLDDLRVFKNDVFFGIITKKSEESLI